jgi:hypothetical protein
MPEVKHTIPKERKCSRCGLDIDLNFGIKGACECIRYKSACCYKIPKIIDESIKDEYYGFGLWDYIQCRNDKQ